MSKVTSGCKGASGMPWAPNEPTGAPRLTSAPAVCNIGASEGICSIVRGRLRQAEDGGNLVADVFLDGAVAGEGLCPHAVVKLANHCNHRFRRHPLRHAGEADDIDEQHG